MNNNDNFLCTSYNMQEDEQNDIKLRLQQILYLFMFV
jgi:hypothetical protein